MEYNLVATTTFGLEGITAKELKALGYEDLTVENGKVHFECDEMDIAIANVHLRTADRIFIKMAEFEAKTFEELFQGTKKVKWSEIIPKDGVMHVVGKSVKSTLFSVPDCQSIVKKAIVTSMSESYGIDHFSEDGPVYKIEVSILKDIVTLSIDTSGVGLHKRGYRQLSSKAPITETLAAALIMLTPWRKDRILVDPFCGSGTFPIEAAMIAANIAPGMNRSFTAEEWSNLIPKKAWYDAIDEANSLINDDIEVDIQGYDIDGDVVRAARENAKEAGVDHLIHFQERAVKDLRHPKKYGFIITNPPYGERLEEKENLPGLYREFGDSFRNLDSWSAYMITSYEDTEKYFGRKADKNRKIYNGMLKTYFYQFLGPKPPKQKK